MTQPVFTEIQIAVQALEKRIKTTEAEISSMREIIAANETLIRGWRSVITTLMPETTQVATAPAKKIFF
jgi:hypothetical protein